MTKRDRLMLLGVLAVVLLGGFWFLVLTPQRKAAADAEARLTTAQASLDAARQRLTAGQSAREAFQRDRTTIVKLGRVVPETDDIPTLLTQLEGLAKKEKVKFNSYTVESASGSGSAATPDDKTSDVVGGQVGTRSTDTVAPLYAPGSIEIDGGLARTPVTLKIEGTYVRLERFLRAVQRFAVLSAKRTETNGRLIIVDGFGYAKEGADAAASSEPPPTDSMSSAEIKKKLDKSLSPTLTATLAASVYYAPPLEAPSASSAGGAAPAAPTPAGGTSTPASTGAAAVGNLR